MGRTAPVRKTATTILFLSILVSTRCAAREEPITAWSGGPCEPFPSLEVEGAQIVIFPAGSGYVEGHRPSHIEEYWTPETDDIRRAESVVRSCAVLHLPHRAAEVQRYARQYTGFVMGGKRLLFVQLFRHAEAYPNWKCVPVVVDDGGDAYFHLEVDPENSECHQFYANGNA